MEEKINENNIQLSSDKFDELLELTRSNNRQLLKITKMLIDMNSSDATLKRIATNFGVGICSNIVGDRILGL